MNVLHILKRSSLRATPRRLPRHGFEVLEDRLLLSTFTVNSDDDTDDETNVRLLAVRFLDEIGPPAHSATADLTEALDDEDDDVAH